MAQSGGSVPVELAGDPGLGGQTLKGWRTAKAILQDTLKRDTEVKNAMSVSEGKMRS